MHCLTWNALHLSFKALCILASVGMIFYWILKYQKDEDVTLVAFKTIKTMNDALQPEFYLCFQSPFLDEKLLEVGSDINSQEYLQYIKGETKAKDSYQLVNYDNVTINPFDYLVSLEVGWRSEENIPSESSNYQNYSVASFKNSFNGFISLEFYKCIGMQLDTAYAKNVSSITMTFSHKLIATLIPRAKKVWAGFHYPQQLLQTLDGHLIWENLSAGPSFVWFKILSFEILKQRFKASQPCFREWRRFDDTVLKWHIEKVGCRAPYMKPYKNFSICDTKTKMKNSMFEAEGVENTYAAPCQGISNLAYRVVTIPTQNDTRFTSIDNKTPLGLILHIVYTDKMKVISQSRLIDGQALLGYIGGYVGLFLGTIVRLTMNK